MVNTYGTGNEVSIRTALIFTADTAAAAYTTVIEYNLAGTEKKKREYAIKDLKTKVMGPKQARWK